MALFPRTASVWFPRINLLMNTGRADQALAELALIDNRPPGNPEEDFEAIIAAAQAMKTGLAADVDKAMVLNLALAHKGAGYASNAIGFASTLGRLDDAFAIANGMYFGRGFEIGVSRFSAMQARFTQFQDRNCTPLLLPSARAMRKDARFAPLVEELGLAKYWRLSGTPPDYQRYKET